MTKMYSVFIESLWKIKDNKNNHFSDMIIYEKITRQEIKNNKYCRILLHSYFQCGQQVTRKRALHARMSHSTACNTTVSTKKTLRTLVK